MLPCADQVLPWRSPAQLGALGPVKAATLPFGIDDGDLAAVFAGEGIVGEEFVDHLFGGESLAEEFEAARAVAHVDVGLGGDAAGAGFGPRHDGADREVLGGDGDAAIAGGGIVGHDGKGIDVGGREGKRDEEAGQDSVHGDSYINAAVQIKRLAGRIRGRIGRGQFESAAGSKTSGSQTVTSGLVVQTRRVDQWTMADVSR